MFYICATPIGNLSDISLRALEKLAQADIILCEDTRVSQKLLHAHGIINKRLVAVHEHNENEMAPKIINWLADGLTLVQISDAGTPGISDPGARICQILYQHQLTPHPLPGACAYISLLSVSGINNIPSLFYGFLPAKRSQRQKQLQQWQTVNYAVAIYESPHRIMSCLEDIIICLGAERTLLMGRELTKQFETIKKASAQDLFEFIQSDSNQQRGEFVLLIFPAETVDHCTSLTSEQMQALQLLATELAPKKAINLTHKLYGGDKDLMYEFLLKHGSKISSEGA